MKKYLLLTVMIVALTAPGMAWSQSVASPAAPATKATAHAKPEDFNARKEKALNHTNDMLKKWQAKQSCIQAATTMDALKVCMPPRKHKDAM